MSLNKAARTGIRRNARWLLRLALEDDGQRGKAMQGNIGQVKRTRNGKKAKSIDSDPIDRT